MKKILGSYFKCFFLFFAFGAGLTYALGYYIQFHVVGNDFWNILYYGRNMSLDEPASLYNGFYPFGYAFLIGQMPFTYVLRLSYLLNALLTGLFTASVSTLILSTRSIPATILAFFSSIAAPFVFQNANTLSPDIGSAAFTAFAVYMLCRQWFDEDRAELDASQAVLIGVSLGLSFLWRTHAAVSILAILAGWLLLFGIRPFRPRLLLLGALTLVAGIQVVVNLISGHGVFETAQAFNLYKYFYGVDWTHPPGPEEIAEFSLIKTISENPVRAFDLYKPFFLYFISHAWAAALAFLISPKGRFARFSLFSMIFILLYAIPISLSDSARSPVILMSVYLPSVAVLLAALVELAQKYVGVKNWVQWAVTALFVAVGFQTFYGWVVYNVGLIRAARSEHRVFTTIEYALRASGMTSPNEVFADRYDFYMPNIMPYRPRQIDKWSVDWLWGFEGEYPLLPNESWAAFAAACREQGIRFLVLSPNSHYRGEIFPPIYNDEVDLETLGLRFIAQRGNLRIFGFE